MKVAIRMPTQLFFDDSLENATRLQKQQGIETDGEFKAYSASMKDGQFEDSFFNSTMGALMKDERREFSSSAKKRLPETTVPTKPSKVPRRTGPIDEDLCVGSSDTDSDSDVAAALPTPKKSTKSDGICLMSSPPAAKPMMALTDTKTDAEVWQDRREAFISTINAKLACVKVYKRRSC